MSREDPAGQHKAPAGWFCIWRPPLCLRSRRSFTPGERGLPRRGPQRPPPSRHFARYPRGPRGRLLESSRPPSGTPCARPRVTCLLPPTAGSSAELEERPNSSAPPRKHVMQTQGHSSGRRVGGAARARGGREGVAAHVRWGRRGAQLERRRARAAHIERPAPPHCRLAHWRGLTRSSSGGTPAKSKYTRTQARETERETQTRTRTCELVRCQSWPQVRTKPETRRLGGACPGGLASLVGARCGGRRPGRTRREAIGRQERFADDCGAESSTTVVAGGGRSRWVNCLEDCLACAQESSPSFDRSDPAPSEGPSGF